MMAILVPERFEREFIGLFEDAESQGRLTANFLASFRWRGAESFTEESTRLLNKAERAAPGAVIAALLGTATIPEHPYNAEFLHTKLKELSLSDRELAWTIPASAAHGEVSTEVGLLLQWAFRVPLNLVSNEQAGLLARVLLWLCTSNHRALRTRASLAAIRVLSKRGKVAAQLVREFHEINDPYLVERLFAVANGVALRERDSQALVELGEAVFQAVFASSEVPPNVLIRNSARSVLEIVNRKGLLPAGISPEAFRPPYRSSFPKIWTEAQVRPMENIEGWRRITASVLPENKCLYGDFGRYVMQSQLWHFSQIKRTSRASPEKDAPPFDAMKARRWIIQRVSDLGWSPSAFNRYDSHLPSGRETADLEGTRFERIGKKYQWIALHELLGYLSDHYKMRLGWNNTDEVFAGPWQLGAGDFDPSQSLRDLAAPSSFGSCASTNVWWRDAYPDPFSDAALCSSPDDWVRQQPSDFLSLIQWQQTPETKSEQLVLGGLYEWAECPELGELHLREGTLKQWCHIRSWLLRSEHFDSTLKAVREVQFWGHGCDMPELNDTLSQYPWGEEFANLREDCEDCDRWLGDHNLPITHAVARLTRDGISNYLPSPQLCALLKAEYSGSDFEFSDEKEQITAYSPPVIPARQSGPLFVPKATLISALRVAGWELIWAVVGERDCFNYSKTTHVADGSLRFSAVYWMNKDQMNGGITKADFFAIPRRKGSV